MTSQIFASHRPELTVRRLDQPLRSYTSHCQATFWLGLVSVLRRRNGRIRIRRAKIRKSANICMYIYSRILINNILINLAGVFEIKGSAGGGAGAGLSPVRCFFSVERLVSLTGIVQKPAGDILTFIVVDHIVKQVFLIFMSMKYWIHSICKLRIAGYYNANRRRQKCSQREKQSLPEMKGGGGETVNTRQS